MAARTQIGGSFAPPITADLLSEYRAAAAAAGDQKIKDAMLQLCDMVELFQQTPASRNGGTPHPSGLGLMVPLEDAEVQRIWDAVPWDYECDAIQSLFDTLSPESPLRTPAFHLLWMAKELTQDREPMTTDKL